MRIALASALLALACHASAATWVNTPYSHGNSGTTLPQIEFDGTNDYLTRGADLTGSVNGRVGTISFWLNVASDGVMGLIYNGIDFAAATGFQLFKDGSSDNIGLILKTSGGSTRLNIDSLNDSIKAASGWQHVFISWDLTSAASPISNIYINGVSSKKPATIELGGSDIDYTDGNFAIGSDTAGGVKLNGCLAQVYINLAEYVAPASGLIKFYNPNLTGSSPVGAVDLGPDGSQPTGSAPLVYLNNSLATWQNNLGAGGNFTENGTLGSCP